MNNSLNSFKNRRIVFLIPLGRIAPSGVRRVQDYKPYLTNAGWKYDIISYDSPLVYRIKQYGAKYKQSVKKFAVKKFAVKSNSKYLLCVPIMIFGLIILILGLLAVTILNLLSICFRTVALISLYFKSFISDVIFIQQVTPPVWFNKILITSNQNIVYDIDDALFHIKPSQTISILTVAKVAVPGSHYNQKFCQSYCGKVVFLPTPVPLDKFKNQETLLEKSKDNFIRIGWVGSPSTAKYLDIISEPFRKLVSRYPDRLRLVIVGLGPTAHFLPDMNCEHIEIIPWIEPDVVPEVVASFHIGIMPLHNTEWEKGKCGLKALEYMAAGIPVVCSGVGENNYIIRDGSNGFIANTTAEWEDKIELLMNDPKLRLRLGQEGKKTIQERYSTKKCFEILLNNVLEPLVITRK